MTTSAERTNWHRVAMRIVLGAVLVLGTATVALHDWLGVGGAWLDRPAEGWLYDAVVVAAGLACLVRAPGAGRERLAWMMIGAAILCWGAAEVYWTAVVLDATRPRPTRRRPTSATSPSTRSPRSASACSSAPAPTSSTGGSGWTARSPRLGTAALGAAFVFDFVADQTERHAAGSRDDARLPARRHRHGRAGRRRRRPDRLATGPHLDRCSSPASRRWRSPTSPTPCSPPTRACRRQLDRPDLPDRRLLPRRRGLAAGRRRVTAGGIERRELVVPGSSPR